MKTSSRVKRDVHEFLNTRAAELGKAAFFGDDEPYKRWAKRIERLSYEEQVALFEILNEDAERKTIRILPYLANTGDLPAQIASFRGLCRDKYDICDCSDAEFLAFRNELHAVWDQQSEGCEEILARWYVGDGDPLSFIRNWVILFKAKTILPTGRNFRAMAANVCARKAEYLRRCANPECRLYFIADRKDGKYCLQPSCIQYGSRTRAREHWRRTHSKASSTRKRKGA